MKRKYYLAFTSNYEKIETVVISTNRNYKKKRRINFTIKFRLAVITYGLSTPRQHTLLTPSPDQVSPLLTLLLLAAAARLPLSCLLRAGAALSAAEIPPPPLQVPPLALQVPPGLLQ